VKNQLDRALKILKFGQRNPVCPEHPRFSPKAEGFLAVNKSYSSL
jgi:hypothetical protein